MATEVRKPLLMMLVLIYALVVLGILGQLHETRGHVNEQRPSVGISHMVRGTQVTLGLAPVFFCIHFPDFPL